MCILKTTYTVLPKEQYEIQQIDTFVMCFPLSKGHLSRYHASCFGCRYINTN